MSVVDGCKKNKTTKLGENKSVLITFAGYKLLDSHFLPLSILNTLFYFLRTYSIAVNI